MQRVGIYCRLSDEDRDKRAEDDESESIQNQKSMLINFCVEQGWEIYNIYCDEDYSGSDRNRPEWLKMIDDCEKRKIDIVLCKTQSRFSRDMEMIERYVHGKFVEWNVRFVGLVDHADTDNGGNKKARQINGLINEWYLEDLSENIRRTLTHKKKSGKWACPFAPYGYLLDPEDKNHFVVDPVASEVVQTIFSTFAGGMGYVSIAKMLNDRGILSPTIYKRQHGINFKTKENYVTSKIWTDSTIYYILRQEAYLGTLIQGKTHSTSYKNSKRVIVPQDKWIRCPHTHEAIIEQELWDTVRGRLRVKSRSSFAGVDSITTYATRHILSGKVFCAVCGNTMYKLSSHSAQGRYNYLKCKTTKNINGLCNNKRFVRMDFLENLVLQEINKLLDEYYNPDLVELPSQQKVMSREKALTIEKKEVLQQIERKRTHSVQLYEDRLDGKISDDQFIHFNQQFIKELETLQTRLKDIESELIAICGSATVTVEKETILSQYRTIKTLTHEIVNQFVNVIYIGIEKEKKEREIEIRWNF